MENVMLKIVGTQVLPDMEEDQIEFVTEGRLYKRKETFYVIYEESEVSGLPGCKTSLKINEASLKMKRLGVQAGIDTVIEFEKGKRYEGMYETPYGSIEMEVLTNTFEKNLTQEGKGSVAVDYNVSLKGLSEGRSKLNIQIM